MARTFDDKINCKVHGKQWGGMICRHLNGAIGKGFYRANPDDKESLEAWCYDCELKLQKIGEWPSGAETVDNFALVCERCFKYAESLNRFRVINERFSLH